MGRKNPSPATFPTRKRGYAKLPESIEWTRFFAERTLSPVYDLIDAPIASGWDLSKFFQRPGVAYSSFKPLQLCLRKKRLVLLCRFSLLRSRAK
jgi:hypothetical protein